MLGAISTPMKEAVRSGRGPRVCPFIGLIMVFGWAGRDGTRVDGTTRFPAFDQFCATSVGIVTLAKRCFCLTAVSFSDLLSPYSSRASALLSNRPECGRGG